MKRNFEQLADAIVLQAVDDYRKAQRQLATNPLNKYAGRDIDSIEKFFRSQWFETLTDIDPEYLIKNLREETILDKNP